jgi:hypothetical protein
LALALGALGQCVSDGRRWGCTRTRTPGSCPGADVCGDVRMAYGARGGGAYIQFYPISWIMAVLLQGAVPISNFIQFRVIMGLLHATFLQQGWISGLISCAGVSRRGGARRGGGGASLRTHCVWLCLLLQLLTCSCNPEFPAGRRRHSWRSTRPPSSGRGGKGRRGTFPGRSRAGGCRIRVGGYARRIRMIRIQIVSKAAAGEGARG